MCPHTRQVRVCGPDAARRGQGAAWQRDRSGPAQPRVLPQAPDAPRPAAPEQFVVFALAGRFSRFWGQRYADTSYLTSADPSCASFAPSEGFYIRKHAETPEFLAFQSADKQSEQRRREQVRARSDCVVAAIAQNPSLLADFPA